MAKHTIAARYIFMDNNSPGVFYYGDMCDMRGLEIEGGHPERCSGEKYKNKRPGDLIAVQLRSEGDLICEKWAVVKPPEHWWDNCGKEAEDGCEGVVSTLDAWMLMLGDCVHDTLSADGETYPCMRWGAVHVHPDDNDLIYMVPLLESDPYGLITDADYPDLKHALQVGIVIEDTEEQDHLVAYTGNGKWVNRTDLIGMYRDSFRPRIVEPCRQSLADICAMKPSQLTGKLTH